MEASSKKIAICHSLCTYLTFRVYITIRKATKKTAICHLLTSQKKRCALNFRDIHWVVISRAHHICGIIFFSPEFVFYYRYALIWCCAIVGSCIQISVHIHHRDKSQVRIQYRIEDSPTVFLFYPFL